MLAGMNVHDWEDGFVAPVAAEGSTGHDWETDSGAERDERHSESGSEENSDSDLETDAEESCLAILLDLLRSRAIGANTFCSLMFHISKMEHPDKLSAYGLRPRCADWPLSTASRWSSGFIQGE